MASEQLRNRLHGITLQVMLETLVEHFGWAELGRRIPVRCFMSQPSIGSSLRMLRRTPWARTKVEGLYLFMLREREREREGGARARAAASAPAPVSAPFGSWTSPVTAQRIVADSIRLGQLAVLDDEVYWTEGRPQEHGRTALVQCTADGRTRDLLAPPLSARSRVHEYGGGAFVVGRRAAFFVNQADQQVWRLRSGEPARALTDTPGARHADLVIDAARKRLICVREDHRGGGHEPVNVLVAIGLAQGDATVLASGDDFYACARVSPDSRQLAWLSWNHPDMPWDGTRLWLAPLRADGTLGHAHCVAGGPDESIFQPSWSPQGELHFVSDRSGWWNLYRLRDAAVQPLLPMAAEFGAAQWAFAMSTYGHCDDGRIVCTYVQDGRSHLAVLAGDAEGLRTVPTPYCTISDVQVAGDNVVFIGTRVDQGAAIVRWNLALGTGQTLRESSPSDLPAAWVSVAQPLAYATTGGATAHAFYYPPTHPHLRGADGERAPLLVMTHGGPTGSTDAGLRWPVQYWTSRGFGVVDVNYRGSTGYGRAYRRALDGRWGVLDVDDAIAAASHLIERGDADPHRVAIRGSSAGGYTTLCALTFHDFFSAGASHYGIGDLEALARDTHKFESRYLDRLIGPYPQAAALYRQRSPIHHTDRLSRPMILFQGVQDRVVPPAQAEAMFAAVRARGLPVAYLLFDGEEHGFRRAENIMRALEAELYFYGRVFGFAPADAIEPVEIWNLAPGAG